VEYLLAPDEGHGFIRPVNQMAMFTAAEAFLARHLGGRFQEGGTAEVVARLKEITVDPRTIVLARKIDSSAVGVPRPGSDLVAATFRYEGQLAMGAESKKLTIHRVVKEEGGTWVVTETLKMPEMPMMGSVEVTTVEKGTLVPVKWSVKQGPVSIDLRLEGAQATGSMDMGGAGPKPISLDLGGPLFGDGAGGQDVLARLPLAPGYSTMFRNLSLGKQKPLLKRLKVVGMEEVKVSAGTFGTWKVEIASAEGEPGVTTLWVDRASRKVVKTSATLPEMRGAVMTTELQP